MQVLGKSLERTHWLWIAISRNRHIDAGRTDVDSGGVLPLNGLGVNRRILDLRCLDIHGSIGGKLTFRSGPVVQQEALF